MLFTSGGRMEALDSRRFLSVSLAASGFTVVTPSSDTRTIYVSNSIGSDDNNGRSPQHPLKSIWLAKSMMRDGSADHLLLKRGDRFVGGFGDWIISGRSADEPILIGSYGKGARPLINTGTGEGIGTPRGRSSIDNVIVKGLHFVAGGYDGTNGGYQTAGVHLVGQADHWLVEDCSIEGFKDNVVLDAGNQGVRDFRLRRCEILDAYCASPAVGNGHAQGIYVSGTSSNTTIQDNIFDHNGWKEGVAGAEPTWFNHSMYINTGAINTVITGNIVTRSSLRGVLLRAGGVVDDNLFVQNPVAIQVGNAASRVTGNVILDGNDQPAFHSGVGIDVIALPSVRIASNIIAHQQSNTASGAAGIQLETGVKKALVTSNIVYDWSRAILNDATRDVTIRSNQLQNPGMSVIVLDQRRPADLGLYKYSDNTYSAKVKRLNRIDGADQSFDDWRASAEPTATLKTIDYSAPTRSMASYNASVGGRHTFMGWLTAIRNQSESGWDTRYTTQPALQYIRAGFSPR
jgi:parallel beta helix pectate lyase-like protein